jgi:DNA-binding CsgD family transcriptional regulator
MFSYLRNEQEVAAMAAAVLEAASSAPAIPALTRWGLSPTADLVYRTLVTFGPQTSEQAGQDLGLPPRVVRQALEELASAGAAQPLSQIGGIATRPSEWEWQPIPVRQVLETVTRRARARIIRVDGWRRHVAVISGIDWSAIDPTAVRHLPNRAIARRRIADLSAAETYEHLAINPEEVFAADAAAAALPVERETCARGIKLRMLGLPPSDGDLSSAYATELAGLGGEYRESGTLPMKLMVFDRRTALFPADPVDFEAGAIEVADPVAVTHLISLFRRYWTEGRDPRHKGVPPIVLNQRERALVALLADGYSDESAAAQLGLSRRTVLYALRSLMDRVGVENRFQLALVLGATGTAPLPAPYGQKDDP